jgi:hypothetical protein
MFSEGCSVTDISFRCGHSHDQRCRTDTPATGCFIRSATRISLASLSCLTLPGCLTSLLKAALPVLVVLCLNLPAFLVVVVAVYYLLFY